METLAATVRWCGVHEHRSTKGANKTLPPLAHGDAVLRMLSEILAKPMRDGRATELTALAGLLSRLELRVFDTVTAEVATSLAATHRLRAADAVHLVTAVVAGADRFLTNNRRDFPETLTDIDVTYPNTLPDPSAA